MTTPASHIDMLFNIKSAYDQAEKLWTKPLQQMLGTETVVNLMGATRESVISQQVATRETLEKQWEALRLPSKSDHAKLAGQVVALENKLDKVEDRLDVLESKLDLIINKLNAVLALGNAEGLAEETDAESSKRRKK